MLKKTIAAFLVVAMLVCFAAVPGLAVSDDEVMTDEAVQAAVEDVFAEFVDADDLAQVSVDDGFVNEIKQQNGGTVTAQELAQSLSEYVLVDKKSLDELTDEIAEDCKYEAAVTLFGKKTIYITVHIADYPELYEEDVFYDAVMKIAEKQIEAIPEGEDPAEYTLLNYERIAGELALHIIAVKVLEPVYDSNRRFSLIGLLFRQFVDADLNIDEWRIPGFIIVAIGKYILNTVYNRIK